VWRGQGRAACCICACLLALVCRYRPLPSSKRRFSSSVSVCRRQKESEGTVVSSAALPHCALQAHAGGKRASPYRKQKGKPALCEIHVSTANVLPHRAGGGEHANQETAPRQQHHISRALPGSGELKTGRRAEQGTPRGAGTGDPGASVAAQGPLPPISSTERGSGRACMAACPQPRSPHRQFS